MTSYRIKNLGVAAGLAIAAIVLVAAYLTNYKRHVQNGEQHVAVYVASKPIPAGTPAADLVNSNLIHKTTVLQRSLVPGFVDDPKKIAGLYVTRPVFTNEQVTLDSFGRANARGVQGQLAGTDRAIDVTATPEQLLAGTVRDGDHVDIVGSWGIGGNSDIKVSRTIIRDVLVVRAPVTGTKAALTSGSAGQNTANAQLKLSDTQARQLFWMMINGDWSLTLRSPVQASNGKDAYDDSGTLLLPALTPAERKAVLSYEANLLKKLGGTK
jgi:Flp pilus assembly protein CpaB